MTVIIGIDCATQETKTGLALAEWNDGQLAIHELALGSRTRPILQILSAWIRAHNRVLLAFDAPLGWPAELGRSLASHLAGGGLQGEADTLFHRYTDDEIRRRLGKRPLEVGANLIARTAHAALVLLTKLRESLALPIDLAWAPNWAGPVAAIEVYPAATRLARAVPDSPGSLMGLEGSLRLPQSPLLNSTDVRDAVVCALAGADFQLGTAVPPGDVQRARKEGWIWAQAAEA